MNKANIQQTGGFPMETDTLDFLQTAYDLFNKFGYLGGNSIIVNGCAETGGNISPGTVFFNGELLPFEGGLKGTYVRVSETTEERQFENGQNKIVYKTRKAVFGSPGVPWSAFQRPKSIWDLTLELDGLKPKAVPVGAIVMWAGAINEIPQGWKLCDGTNGTPDLSGKFIVGYADNDSDYDTIGKTGGAKSVTLSEEQMPKHKHSGTADSAGSHTHLTVGGNYNDDGQSDGVGGAKNVVAARGDHQGAGHKYQLHGIDNATTPTRGITSTAGAHSHSLDMKEKGNNEAHENRPPYYTLAYIQFKNQ